MQSPVSYISKAGGDTCKRGIAAKYAVKVELPADRPWHMRDFRDCWSDRERGFFRKAAVRSSRVLVGVRSRALTKACEKRIVWLHAP